MTKKELELKIIYLAIDCMPGFECDDIESGKEFFELLKEYKKKYL